MPHFRSRFAAQYILKLAKLWPVVGVLGLRQSGKTTLMQQLFQAAHLVSLDDLAMREEASRSPNTFLKKLTPPVVLDEVQKAPAIFDAIKLNVDQKRIPGSYFLTGSTAFSSKIGIRESLTGRIGLVELFPLSLAELHAKPFRPLHQWVPTASECLPRFSPGELGRAAVSGGLPVPAFMREKAQRDLYWRSWLETTILRDLSAFFPRQFDADFAFLLLERMASLLRNGELPTLKHFTKPARKIRAYLTAMENVFLLRKINCHPLGTGKEIWLFMDSGLAAYLMGQPFGEGVTLSLVRHFILNEISVQAEYQGKRLTRTYYKSAQGSAVDFVLDNIPFRIVPNVTSVTNQLHWEERPLLGAMKKLGSQFAYLVAPINKAELPPAKGGVGILPWSIWS
ncbi:MAG: ATP-binding protein [Gammaproteobacteria bacterium]|nr:ATP-binding protein [Gammaproteobacteria bacterium]